MQARFCSLLFTFFRFASRAKSIKNKPIVNEVLSEAALLKRYAKEIKKLKESLEKERNTDKAQEVEQVRWMQCVYYHLKLEFVFVFYAIEYKMDTSCTKMTNRWLFMTPGAWDVGWTVPQEWRPSGQSDRAKNYVSSI